MADMILYWVGAVGWLALVGGFLRTVFIVSGIRDKIDGGILVRTGVVHWAEVKESCSAGTEESEE